MGETLKEKIQRREDVRRQKRDFEWYKKNLAQLYEKYGDCYIAICDKKVLNCYEDMSDAICDMMNTRRPGSYIIQVCGPDASAYTNFVG